MVKQKEQLVLIENCIQINAIGYINMRTVEIYKMRMNLNKMMIKKCPKII
jgi:hypothetical protein